MNRFRYLCLIVVLVFVLPLISFSQNCVISFTDVTNKPKIPTVATNYNLNILNILPCDKFCMSDTIIGKNVETGKVEKISLGKTRHSLTTSLCDTQIIIKLQSEGIIGGQEDITFVSDLTETSRAEISSTILKSTTGALGTVPSYRFDIGANGLLVGGRGKFIIKNRGGAKYEIDIVFTLEYIGQNNCFCVDTIPPVIKNCPTQVSKYSLTATDCVPVTWQTPIATDNISIPPSVSSNYPSGYCFPVGTTKVIYTAKDAAGNTSTCSFDVTVKPNCTRYTVDNTQQICSPNTWKPYALMIGNTLYKAEQVTFVQSFDGTATLTGVFRDNRLQPVTANITMSGYTKNLSAFGRIRNYCLLNAFESTQDWFLYPNYSGTLQFGNYPPVSILKRSNFQFGTGANMQNIFDFGGAATFTIDGQSAQFGFKLNNPILCSATTPLMRAAFNAEGAVEPERIKLQWVENVTEEGDAITIEKVVNGTYEVINTLKPLLEKGLRHYTVYDENPVEGINHYRISLKKQNGYIENQTVTLGYSKQAYAQIFPNPVADDMQVILQEKPKNKVTLHLYNATGYEVKTVVGDGNTAYTIQTDDLPAGLYMLRIAQSGKRDYMKQVIISH
jgi:hypothetical protein